MTTTDPKEPNPPSETASVKPEPSSRHDAAEELESGLLRAIQKINREDREKSQQKSPPHLHLVKRP